MEHSPSGESDFKPFAGASASGAAIRLPLSFSIRREHPLARLLCRGDVTVLTLRPDGRLGLEYSNGSVFVADVEADTTVFPALVVLRYRVDGCPGVLVLPRVAIGAEAHRRLRVWLNWCGAIFSKRHEPT